MGALVTVEPARIPNPQAVPVGMGAGQGAAAVVNVHTKSAASAMPNWSRAPVVIAAVYWVFSARGLEGVKVATRFAESRETVPVTGDAPANVKVPVLIVAGFMALLNVAETKAPWQMPVEAPAGITETTVGGVRLGFPVPGLLVVPQHPANTKANRNAGVQILLTFNFRISFSSLPSCTAFQTVSGRPEDRPEDQVVPTTFNRLIR
jgi:hypothetical protein